ncbi:MAG: hypothetical protein KGL39_04245 [Patescibacteria group bacterium]|nr:hypothetical protein [Patescibacteria group bacterium]
MTIESIKKRLAEATPGPWELVKAPVPRNYPGDPWIDLYPVERGGGTVYIARFEYAEGDADLIAHAPTDLAALIRVAEAASEFLDSEPHVKWRGICEFCGRDWPCRHGSLQQALAALEAGE